MFYIYKNILIGQYIIIEADSFQEVYAKRSIANIIDDIEVWNGWNSLIDQIIQNGLIVDCINTSAIDWLNKYSEYKIEECPQVISDSFGNTVTSGKLQFDTLEEYIQYLVNEYSFAPIGARIYYSDGRIVDVFKNTSRYNE